MDCSPPGSSVHGISQARILDWVANSPSRGSFYSGVKSESSLSFALADRFFVTEPPGNILPRVTEAIDHRYNDDWASQVVPVIKNPPVNAG